MRAIAYKTIDGFDVVLGEDRPLVDPQATLRRAKEKILLSPSVRERLSLLRAPTSDGATAFAREVMGLVKAYADDHPVYFSSIPGQKLMAPKAAEKLLATERPEGFLLGIDGVLIPDLRGRTYWVHDGTWRPTIIRKLGELPPPGALFSEELTAKQKKKIRLQRPSHIQMAEKAQREASARKEALELRQLLELTEEPERALEIARKVFRQELDAIAEDYIDDPE